MDLLGWEICFTVSGVPKYAEKKIKNDGKSEWLQILTSEKYQAQLKKWMATSLI